MQLAVASNSFSQHSIAIGGFLVRLQPLHLDYGRVPKGRSIISKSTLFILFLRRDSDPMSFKLPVIRDHHAVYILGHLAHHCTLNPVVSANVSVRKIIGEVM